MSRDRLLIILILVLVVAILLLLLNFYQSLRQGNNSTSNQEVIEKVENGNIAQKKSGILEIYKTIKGAIINLISQKRKDLEYLTLNKISDWKNITLEVDDKTKIKFIYIPATTSKTWKEISGGKDYYMMGGNLSKFNPPRPIKLTYDFYISETEITQEQWEKIMGYNPSKNNYNDNIKTKNHPVESISWEKAYKFIYKLKEYKSKKIENYEIRLPTEAEWEYSARAGMSNIDDDYLENKSWHGNSTMGTIPVASKEPNEWGLYDMLGNVFELTHDCFPSKNDILFGKQSKLRINPIGEKNYTNLRGGAYFSREHVQNFSWRSDCYNKSYKGSHLGFRLVIAPRTSFLNKDKEKYPKQKKKLLSTKKIKLNKLYEENCTNDIILNDVSLIKEYNNSILLKACYENNLDEYIQFNVDVKNRNKNKKTGYKPRRANPGKGCVEIQVSVSSRALKDFSSDSITLEPYNKSGRQFNCIYGYELKKDWTIEYTYQ